MAYYGLSANDAKTCVRTKILIWSARGVPRLKVLQPFSKKNWWPQFFWILEKFVQFVGSKSKLSLSNSIKKKKKKIYPVSKLHRALEALPTDDVCFLFKKKNRKKQSETEKNERWKTSRKFFRDSLEKVTWTQQRLVMLY